MKCGGFGAPFEPGVEGLGTSKTFYKITPSGERGVRNEN